MKIKLTEPGRGAAQSLEDCGMQCVGRRQLMAVSCACITNTGQFTCRRGWGVGCTRGSPLPEKPLCAKNNQNQGPDQAGNSQEGVGKGGDCTPQRDTCAPLLPCSQSCCGSGEGSLTPGAPVVPGRWGFVVSETGAMCCSQSCLRDWCGCSPGLGPLLAAAPLSGIYWEI